ncbi:MAG: ThiF family adenylyltransferase [Sedimentisphaerales bacterium]|nr:ThiF family adenylyltransferase [Sedimentisphaerales bacterium]
MTDRQEKADRPGTGPDSGPDSEPQPNPDPLGRYCRQMNFPPIGRRGQERLAASCVVLIGCGALGAQLAGMIVRAGVGRLTIVDRDYLELNNLQRQTLFDEQDVERNLPKAAAAADKLRRINSQVEISPIIADANHESIEQFVQGADLILDGTDNMQTRFLINDVAIKNHIPWIYGACLAAAGMALVILPAGRPCLRCLIESPPAPGEMATCETAGILAPTVARVAAFQLAEALKILTGNMQALNRNFYSFDLWLNRTSEMAIKPLPADCPCCGERKFDFLAGAGSLGTISLCGRQSVQVRPRRADLKLDLADLARRLRDAGRVVVNPFLLRLELPGREITIFPDARAIVKGTSSIDEARSLYAKYVGH